MADVAALIADLIGAGLDGALVGRVAAALAEREAVLVPDESAERRRAADRERKRLRKSAEVSGIRGKDAEDPSPKEVSPTPLQEITPSDPSTHKEITLRVSKKGSRLPDDFVPDLAWAIAEGLTPSQADTEAAKFRDHWTAKSGQNATKRDWQATWRNWVRTAIERMPRSRAGPSGPKTGAIINLGERLIREMDAANAGTSAQDQGHQQAPLSLSHG
jgi:hypothetical protein